MYELISLFSPLKISPGIYSFLMRLSDDAQVSFRILPRIFIMSISLVPPQMFFMYP